MTLRASRLVVLQVLVSVVALGAVVWWASRQPLPTLPSLGDALPRLAAALGLYALATVLRGERWLQLLRQGGARLGRGDAYALTTVGYMGNNALPARAGDLLKAVLSARRSGSTATGALGTLVAERLLDAAALALVFVLLVTTLSLPLGVPGWLLALVGVGLASAAVAAALLGRRHRSASRLVSLVGALLAPSRGLWHVRGAAMLVLSLALWVVEGSIYAILGPVVGIQLSLLEGLYIMALANLVSLVPAAPGYVGTYDAAVLLGVRLVDGGARAAALSYVVLMRFVLFVPIALVGLVAMLTRYGGLSAARRAITVRARPVPVPATLPEARSAA